MTDPDLTPEIEVQPNAHEWEPDAAKEYYSAQDLTPEAVERLASHIQNTCGCRWRAIAEGQDFTRVYLEVCADRDALSAALKDVRSEYDDFRRESVERERDFARKMGKLEARAEAAEAKLKEAVAVMRYLKSEAWGCAPSFETEFHLDVHAECAAFLASIGNKP